MPRPAHPGRMLFVNVPVADLQHSKAFFADLGFSYNPNFTDETAACMLVGAEASSSSILSKSASITGSSRKVARPTRLPRAMR